MNCAIGSLKKVEKIFILFLLSFLYIIIRQSDKILSHKMKKICISRFFCYIIL